MNIFITDESPTKSAFYLDDKRVVKMILESTQMLCTAINEAGHSTPYKTTHKNHPSNIWVRQSKQNWIWLWEHAYELMDRYQAVYDKQHKCRSIIIDLIDNFENVLPDIGRTPFANCAAHAGKNISYKHIASVPEAYRRYLVDRWNGDVRTPTWKKRRMPEWITIDKEGRFVYSG